MLVMHLIVCRSQKRKLLDWQEPFHLAANNLTHTMCMQHTFNAYTVEAGALHTGRGLKFKSCTSSVGRFVNRAVLRSTVQY